MPAQRRQPLPPTHPQRIGERSSAAQNWTYFLGMLRAVTVAGTTGRRGGFRGLAGLFLGWLRLAHKKNKKTTGGKTAGSHTAPNRY